MSVTEFGTPVLVRATSGSVTGTWGSGQNRVAGDLLVAVVTAGGTTASAAAISTPAGWTQQAVSSNTATTANAWVAQYTKTATGSDSAPSFTATLSGAAAMTCTLLEFAAASNATPVDTSGVYGSGGSAGTLSAMAVTSNGPVSTTGEFAVTAYAQQASAATNTWNPGTYWTNAVNDGATSSILHTAVDYAAGVGTPGSTSTETAHWTANSSAFGAAVMLIIATQAGAVEQYANQATTTITAGGSTTPASGTAEYWTATSWSAFGAASNTTVPPTKFHVTDTAAGLSGETITVLNTATGLVIRGSEGTTPVSHASGFTVENVVPAGVMRTLPQVMTGASVSVSGIFGTRPEWFGSISGVTGDEVAINLAIAAVARNAAGCPGPVVITQPCGVSNTITAVPGVNFAGHGQGNRQNFPDTFTGGYIFPSPSFPSSGALITVGTSGQPTTNPCGIKFEGINLSGLLASGSAASGCTGILIADTADAHLIDVFLGNFDRGGATGTAVQASSSSAGNGVGLNLHHSVISNSWRGVYTTGAGLTDLRFSGNLWHANTQQLTLGGSNLGGGGAQITNDHFTYTGMPSSGYHLLVGSQGGDFAFSNNYFDQAGSAIPVQLASGKGLFNGNHFLATATSTAASLVKLSTSGSQQLTFCNNNCNAQGSSITALFQTTAHAGAPTGGNYSGNTVYGGAPSLIAVLIDSAGTAIAAANTGSLYVQGNVTYT